MAEYILSNVAKEDLIRIHQYGVRKFGVAQADAYVDALFEYFELIAAQPFLFESVDCVRKGYRHCVCGVDPIYYRINEGNVEIMAIIGRQDLSDLF